MKILILRDSPTEVKFNNYNVQELGLARALAKKNHNVGVVFFTKGNYKEEMLDNVKVYYVPGKKAINHVIFDDIIYDLCEQYDIIQTSEYNQLIAYRVTERFPNKTVTYHGPFFKKSILSIGNNVLYDIVYLRKFLKLNPTMITKSYLAEDFLRKKGFKDVKTLGVGLNKDSIDDGEHVNKEFIDNYNKKDINLLCVANVIPIKNILFLLKVLNELVKENGKYKLFLIGKSNSKYKNKCVDYIKKNNLDNHVVFIEKVNQNELKHIYNSCECLLFASKVDIFGMVLLEASYFNVPILTSLNGGSSYLFDKKDILKELDVEVWKNEIKNIKKRKNKLKKKILWEDIADDFIDVYNRKLNGDKNE